MRDDDEQRLYNCEWTNNRSFRGACAWERESACLMWVKIQFLNCNLGWKGDDCDYKVQYSMSLDFYHYLKACSILGHILDFGWKENVKLAKSILLLNNILESGLRKTCHL